MMSIGRNEPCFCGSGLKYKKCCINKSTEEQSALYEAMDTPRLSQHFFDLQPFKKVSQPALVWGMLTLPATMEKVNQLSKQMNRGKDEADFISGLSDAAALVERMNEQTDKVNHKLLLDQLVKHKEAVTPIVLDKLATDDEPVFVELAVRYLHEAGIEDWEPIAKLAAEAESAYKRSLLSLLLGVKGPEDKLPLVWKQYLDLKKQKGLQKDEEQGPLYGLMEYGYRLGFLDS
ncbi:hypothetical protein DQG23_06910 [Paenibacillus contaminans]|uniref:SEC-C domain-containing protein n=2 Tax=Paenibacillus contaminans TaxID=450362 RepID=A0A329MWB0_9BACL|nr:hypothetical protein DQG23_06910 [Paenibacillus contaminans]